jgi:Cof subfamily protein (haloacid dehalogenase superfamily)
VIYRLLVLDLDGTVMGDDLQIRPAVRQAVRQAQDRGVAVTLATGRAFDSALGFAKELGITAPLVCYQGGLIQSPVDGRVLHAETYPLRLAHELLAWVARRKEQPFLAPGKAEARWPDWDDAPFPIGAIETAMFIGGTMYMESADGDPGFWPRYFGQSVQMVDRLAEALHREPNKSMLIAHPVTCDEIVPELKRAFEGRLQILRSHPLFVEAVPEGVTKGHGVARLAKHLGVSRSATIAVGDNENDLAMVEWAGLGVAMGNATPEVKAIAGWVAPPVSEDGVAAVVERFILQSGVEVAGSEGFDADRQE